ncbi:putative membrane protein YeaQ/YmgE (transglycosylase-associated protein family) [Saccharopolyspora spinosa]|uniref:Membrane protein YeaQ/YmgE (Transglycosylase-associated protein family) n=2 Tax=Saccharopolyspora spinosa TaxID=60894 RepID=A0A2N3Y4F6_SACSN|nr:putative membrane protein YeaQ/YmgE (transglycosylase-associated protein family) [Saccharopolyspora spinosa]
MNAMLWTVIGWLVFGLIAGFIARAVVPGKDDIGLLMTIVIGVAGSVVGGFLFGLLTVGFRGFQPAGWIGSVIGAVIVLVIYNKVTGRKRLRR